MRGVKNWLLMAMMALVLVAARSGQVLAQDFEDPGSDDSGDAWSSLIDSAVFSLEGDCFCDGDSGAYERCLDKRVKKEVKAFKAAIKFVGGSQAEFKSELNSEVDDLVSLCEEDDGGDPDEGLPPDEDF